MSLTRAELGERLKTELERTSDVSKISDWAHCLYLDHHEFGSGVYEALMELIAMQEGPEFEMAPHELRDLAQRLMSET